MRLPPQRGRPKVGRGIDRPAVQDHLEIQMRTQADAGPADNPKLLARRNRALSFGKRRRDHAEMAVDADEAVMLDQHLQPTRTLALNADHVPGAAAMTARPTGRGQIDAIVVGAGFRHVRQHARAER